MRKDKYVKSKKPRVVSKPTIVYKKVELRGIDPEERKY